MTIDTETRVSSPVARRFVDALRGVEDQGDPEGMAELAAAHTRWSSAGSDRSLVGPEGAREFWEAYRRAYADITSEFTAITETDSRAVLEWVGTGHHHDGRPVRYVGATVLDLGDTSVDAVRLYFDTAAARSGAPEGEEAAADMLDDATAASGRNNGLAP